MNDPLKSLADAHSFLQGESLGVQTILYALIETHPRPAELLRRLQEVQQRGEASFGQVPPPDIQRFRCEQVIEQAVDSIQRRLRETPQ